MKNSNLRWWYFLPLVLLALLLAARFYADHRIQRAIDGVNQDGNSLTVGEYSFSLIPVTLSARDLDYKVTTGGSQLEGSLTDLSVRGINAFGLLLGNAPQVDRLRLDSLDLTVTPGEDTTSGGGNTAAFGLGRFELANSRITYVRAENTYTTEVATLEVDGLARDSNWSVRRVTVGIPVFTQQQDGRSRVRVDSIALEQGAATYPVDAREIGATSLTIASAVIGNNTEQYDYNLRALAYDSEAARLSLGAFERVNRLKARDYHSKRKNNSWTDFSFTGIAVEGVDRDRFLRDEELDAQSVSLAKMDINVVEDLGRPPSRKRKKMPLEALRSLGYPLSIATASMEGYRVSYGVTKEGADPARITITGKSASVEGINTRVNPDRSLTATSEATFMGQSPIQATFVLPHTASGRSARFTGEMGAFDLTGLNPILLMVMDMKLASGRLTGVSYDYDLEKEHLSGTTNIYYKDIDIEKPGIGGFFLEMGAKVLANSDNQPGANAKPGPVDYTIDPYRSFFSAYWKGLANGIQSTLLPEALVKEN